MKKLFVALLVIGLIFTVNANTASADGGPHGGYTATTDECARCHRAHSGTQANLSTVAPGTLCLSCHGAAATGANSDVEDGVWEDARDAIGTAEGTNAAGLNAGGFLNAYDQINTAFEASLSAHSHDSTVTNAWTLAAGGAIASTALAGGDTLDCADCHDPHGSTNYRLFPTTVNGVAVTVDDFDSASKNYTDEAWGSGNTISNLCASCHTNYHQTAAASGDGGFFTHRVDVAWNGDGATAPDIGFGTADNPETGAGLTLPLAGAGDTVMVCSSCHFSHGSAAAMGTYSQAAAQGSSPSLLRLDNRATCQVCHDK